MLQELVRKLENFKSKSLTRRAWKSEIHFLVGFLAPSVSVWILTLIFKLSKHTMIDMRNGLVGMNL